MADNSLVIVCEICCPQPSKWQWRDPGIFVLAKYFYSMSSKRIEENELASWMREHLHGVVELAAMPIHFSLQWEHTDVWAEKGASKE